MNTDCKFSRTQMRYVHQILLSTSFIIPCSMSAAHALTGVNPTGVNVRSQGPTSVFLTFQGTNNETSGEAFWCSRVVAGVSGGSVVPFNPCVPGTLLGNLPQQFNLSQPSGSAVNRNFTDIMTIPSTIARKAYQIAASGGNSGFFYIRRFNGPNGPQYGVVTCRLSSGGARSPLALMNIELLFDEQMQTRPVTYFANTSDINKFYARIKYNGAGRLIGRWEIVQPGDPEPTQFDLLPAGSLPIEQRSQQTRYRQLAPFDIYLPPNGSATISGPDPKLLNTKVDGDYRILFRLSASTALDSVSQTNAGLASAGGVSGFSIPFLRYNVGSRDTTQNEVKGSIGSSKLARQAHDEIAITASLSRLIEGDAFLNVFSWTPIEGVDMYELTFSFEDGKIYRALVPGTQSSYESQPFWFASSASSFSWRVQAYNRQGQILGASTETLVRQALPQGEKLEDIPQAQSPSDNN